MHNQTTNKKKDELLEIACMGGIGKLGGGSHIQDSNSDSNSPVSSVIRKPNSFVDELELSLQMQDYDFQGPSCAYFYAGLERVRTPSPCVDATMAAAANELDEDLPDPPPPPKSPAPPISSLVCPGILRQPGTPGSAKKRVQIQEISV